MKHIVRYLASGEDSSLEGVLRAIVVSNQVSRLWSELSHLSVVLANEFTLACLVDG